MIIESTFLKLGSTWPNGTIIDEHFVDKFMESLNDYRDRGVSIRGKLGDIEHPVVQVPLIDVSFKVDPENVRKNENGDVVGKIETIDFHPEGKALSEIISRGLPIKFSPNMLIDENKNITLISMDAFPGERKVFRFHRGGFDESLKTSQIVDSLKDIIELINKEYDGLNIKNIRMIPDKISDDRLSKNGWSGFEYVVLGDLEGHLGAPIGFANFFESSNE